MGGHHQRTLPGSFYESYGFPKRSPLLPFFNHAYKKIRESGVYQLKKINWNLGPPKSCKSVTMSSFPMKKVISLFAFLCCGFALSGLIFAFEFCIGRKKQPDGPSWVEISST